MIVKAAFELDIRNLSIQILSLEERNEILERERMRDFEGNKHQVSSKIVFINIV